MLQDFKRLFEKRLRELLLAQPALEITMKIGKASEFPKRRDYAYSAWNGERAQIVFAPKISRASTNRQDALIRHELSHALLQSAELNHNERECDAVAERIFGDRIYYDSENVQTLNEQNSRRPRPTHLPR